MFRAIVDRFKKKIYSSSSDEVFEKLKKGDIAIDCGASIGDVTEKMAAQGAEVYSFEPNPYTFKHLSKRFENVSNVHVYNQGVLNKDAVMPFYFHENFPLDGEADQMAAPNGSSFLAIKGNVRKDNPVDIQVIDLSKFILALNAQVKLLKIDVEGVEIEIVNGLIDSGAIHKVDKVYVETHEKKISELVEPTQALRQRLKKEKIKHVNLDWF